MTRWLHRGAWLLLLTAAATLQGRPEVNLFAWSEYIPQKVIDGFTKETGIAVNYETFSSNEEMVSKLVAGGGDYDVIQPSEYTAEALIKANLLAKLDLSRLPHRRNIDPELLHLAFDPNGEYEVPYMSGTVGIVVNTAVVRDPIRGYRDVFQPKYSGRIVVVNDNREIVSWALATQGHSPNDINTETLTQARPLISEWIKLIKVYDSDSPKTALLNGDVDLGIVWSGEAAILWNQDKKFRYVLPAEGTHRFIDLFAMPAGAPHPREALQFIDYILRPEVSVLISNEFPYTNPNLAARALLTPEQRANPASYPAVGKLEIFRDIGRESAAVDRLMTDLKSAQ